MKKIDTSKLVTRLLLPVRRVPIYTKMITVILRALEKLNDQILANHESDIWQLATSPLIGVMEREIRRRFGITVKVLPGPLSYRWGLAIDDVVSDEQYNQIVDFFKKFIVADQQSGFIYKDKLDSSVVINTDAYIYVEVGFGLSGGGDINTGYSGYSYVEIGF